MTIDVSLNGERIAAEASTLQNLLLARGYKLESAFACAINSTFVPRPQWPRRRSRPAVTGSARYRGKGGLKALYLQL